MRDLKLLWDDRLKYWTQAVLWSALLGWAVHRSGAEYPADRLMLTAYACILIVVTCLFQENRDALLRIRNWRTAVLGLALLVVVMLVQLVPIEVCGGGPDWGSGRRTSVDHDLTVRAIINLGTPAAFLLCGCIAGAVRGLRGPMMVCLAAVLASVIIQGLGEYAASTAAPPNGTGVPPRIDGTFLSNNSFSAALSFSIPILFGSLAYGLQRWPHINFIRIAVIAILIIGTITCIVISQSRSAALLMLLSAMLVFGALYPRTRLIILGVGAVGIAAYVWAGASGGSIFGVPVRAMMPEGDITDGRMTGWLTAWRMFEASPCLGTGAGTFALSYEPVRELPTQRGPFLFITVPHNFILFALAETGLVGMIAWSILALGLARMVLLGVRHARSRMPMAVGLAGALLAMTAQNIFDWSFTIPALAAAWGLAAGYCAGLGAGRNRRVESQPRGISG